MYVIIAYDVDVSRVNKIKSFLRTYLNWIQNSLFEGELTDSQLLQVKNKLLELIKSNDSVVIYQLKHKNVFKKDIIGVDKSLSKHII